MVRTSFFALSLALLSFLFAEPATAQSVESARDWTTWGYDHQRTGWNRGETTLTKDNVSRLRVLWNAQLSTPPKDVVLSTLTAPLVVEGVRTAKGTKNLVFLLGADDTVFALDADTGKVRWQKSFPNPLAPARPATWLCSNTVNDTPVIDKQRDILFLITSDGKLRGLNLSDGVDRMTPTVMVETFARAWSLNLIDGVVYTTSGRGCGQFPGQAPQPLPVYDTAPPAATPTSPGDAGGAVPHPNLVFKGPIVTAAVSAMDVTDLAHPQLTRFYTSGSKSSGPWGRGGVAEGPKGTIITQTADGFYDPAAGDFGETVLKLAPKAARLLDSFTPVNWRNLNLHDLDLGSASSDVFTFGSRTLIAVSGKEGFLYLLDAADLGGGPPGHSTPLYKSPQLGNDAGEGINPGQGVWGAVASYESPDGKHFLYLPMWGPPAKDAAPFLYSSGAIPHGSIMAFQVSAEGGKVSLIPQWTSPDMTVPDPPVVANGVVYAIQTGEQTIQSPTRMPGLNYVGKENPLLGKFRSIPVNHLVLFAFDAETGKQLYSSNEAITNWTHFSEPVVALGKVFVVTHDAHVYAFGL
jgi:outer membrane protein assembly factor BamB